MRSSRLRLAVGLLSLAVFGIATARPTQALQINPIYDSSVSSRSDFAQIQSAFNQADAAWSNVLSDNVTINIKVSWGSVGPYSLGGSGTLAGALDSIYGYYSYSQVKSWLTKDASTATDQTAIKNLPAVAPSVLPSNFVLPSSLAKALGLLSATNSAYDGYIGFGSSFSWDYDRSNGISAGSYDFVGVAEHEIEHVLGQISGLGEGWVTPLDLFRCSGGAPSFSYNAAAYFSIDGCKTNLGNFNNVGTGDREDWASTPSSTDIKGAFLYPGIQYSISTADITVLDAIGWGTKTTGGTSSLASDIRASIRLASAVDPVPEPSTLLLLAVGALGLGLLRRRLPI